MTLFKRKTSQLDEMIVTALMHVDSLEPGSEKWNAKFEHLERLHKLRAEGRGERVSANTMAIVAGNLLGILIMVGYEHKHVITSKSLGFLLKPRVD
jgi:hypothetical protein